MGKYMRVMAVFVMCMAIFMGMKQPVYGIQIREMKYDKKVPIDKVWRITFSKNFIQESINKDTVKLKDKDGNELDITTKIIDEKTVEVSPVKEYRFGTSYTLFVGEGVKGINEETLGEEVSFSFETEEYSMSELSNFIGWEAAINYDAYAGILNDDSVVNRKAKNQTLRSISPLTYFFNYKDGKFESLKKVINDEYMTTLKNNGYELIPTIHVVWDQGIHRSFKDFVNNIGEFFSDEEKESKIIEEISNSLDELEANKIIIDFEALGGQNREGFTDFIKKLKNTIGDKEIMICVAYPYDGSAYFDFINITELEPYTDAFMFMAYDERGINSEDPGSISSYPWVKFGVDVLLDKGVPNNKLILAIPFYTRDFAVVQGDSEFNSVIVTKRVVSGKEAALYEKPSETSKVIKTLTYGEQFVTQDYFEDGNDKWYKVKVGEGSGYLKEEFITFLTPGDKRELVVGVDRVRQKDIDKIMKEGEDISIAYDESSKQNVLTYYKYDRAKTVRLKHKIWLEDEESLQWRIKLIKDYKLKGGAGWRLGYENEDFYDK
ncbi:glycosyl hydrolase family 18 protein [Oceanirhabdus sp. W0125-5]|uniref:glycosyl hydrolase family 18 protein n=1 Tax=Oceanirhabdus sp. W0125-5 TaxID=2999116 RepID=UPI0022F31319|nr:glycosyl hydrolase family 18 protein [Oceanirhabdus sp. W0125-5]WBW97434.1 glycosyl hydrolase family 18 protein [Oceanirhabdus sp. W0125-5]